MIFDKIIESIWEGEAEDTQELTKQALAQGYPAEAILKKGLITGMTNVADKFRERRVVVPEVLMATRAMHAGLALIEPHLYKSSKKTMGKFVLGTVAGDLHDIGLTLVKMMVIATGSEVIDLGVDVTAKKFLSSVKKEKPDGLLMSSLLTTTMAAMKEVIDLLEAEGLRKGLIIIVGGAPLSAEFAKEIGADYFFSDAFEVHDFVKSHFKRLAAKKNR